jgi:hypothetical protein
MSGKGVARSGDAARRSACATHLQTNAQRSTVTTGSGDGSSVVHTNSAPSAGVCWKRDQIAERWRAEFVRKLQDRYGLAKEEAVERQSRLKPARLRAFPGPTRPVRIQVRRGSLTAFDHAQSPDRMWLFGGVLAQYGARDQGSDAGSGKPLSSGRCTAKSKAGRAATLQKRHNGASRGRITADS